MKFLEKIKDFFFSEKSEQEKKEEDLATKMSETLSEGKEVCSFCGEALEGKCVTKKQSGQLLRFHRRCWKKIRKGKLPTHSK